MKRIRGEHLDEQRRAQVLQKSRRSQLLRIKAYFQEWLAAVATPNHFILVTFSQTVLARDALGMVDNFPNDYASDLGQFQLCPMLHQPQLMGKAVCVLGPDVKGSVSLDIEILAFTRENELSAKITPGDTVRLFASLDAVLGEEASQLYRTRLSFCHGDGQSNISATALCGAPVCEVSTWSQSAIVSNWALYNEWVHYPDLRQWWLLQYRRVISVPFLSAAIDWMPVDVCFIVAEFVAVDFNYTMSLATVLASLRRPY